ncbi:GPO family capsid scaffolding protein [Salmonella enterica]|uniref:GPO family capsid scaffolding protein n=1 Tax=Salmonella enterica I TaxID=59201 RepID=A0A5U3ERS4_SALET|nr:capsid protein [Salmonella enterica subsp. diarizonae]EBP3998734.1 GPO family capsid scaffolding protein [Salmonella enterica subsp. enterica]ELB6470226.1 GPO family capsid scaffolding protein [Salmonella enterica]
MKVSKKFRVVTEGTTVDGRVLSRQQIQDMADTYDPKVYTAGVNIEHLNSPVPNSLFRNYGKVRSLSAEEVKGGMLDGKLGLHAVVELDDKLPELFGTGQKQYPSIEYYPRFSDTGKAYCAGLGFTDTPASLGTEIVKFSAGLVANEFAVGDEISLEFEDDDRQPTDNTPGLLARIRTMFSNQSRQHDVRFTDMEKAIELMAEKLQGVAEKLTTTEKPEKTATPEPGTDIQALRDELATLKEKLSNTDADPQHRPSATGVNALKTDC